MEELRFNTYKLDKVYHVGHSPTVHKKQILSLDKKISSMWKKNKYTNKNLQLLVKFASSDAINTYHVSKKICLKTSSICKDIEQLNQCVELSIQCYTLI